MKAIWTRYIGPSNIKGSRICVTDGDTRIYVSYDHAAHDAHLNAALEFCKRRGWGGRLHQGGMKNGNVFVWDNGEQAIEVEGKVMLTREAVLVIGEPFRKAGSHLESSTQWTITKGVIDSVKS